MTLPTVTARPARYSSLAEQEVVSTDLRWRTLHRIAGLAALIIAILIPLQAAVFIISPPPETVTAYLDLFQTNPLLGLLDLDLLLTLDQLLLVPVFLALYIRLRQIDESWVLVATALAFLGIALYMISREATFTMMALSNQYATASTEAQRAMLLGAGQAFLAAYYGTNFHLSYIIGQIAGIILSALMLRAPEFGKVIGYAGILGNLVGFGLYVPGVGIYLSLFSVVGLWIWFILLAYKLSRLGTVAARP